MIATIYRVENWALKEKPFMNIYYGLLEPDRLYQSPR
jgi:hypothetical protein